MDILFNLAFFILVFSSFRLYLYLIFPVGVAAPKSACLWVPGYLCVRVTAHCVSNIAKKFEFNEWEIN